MAIGRTRVYVRWISQVVGGGGWWGEKGLILLNDFGRISLCLKIKGGLAGLPISIPLIKDNPRKKDRVCCSPIAHKK